MRHWTDEENEIIVQLQRLSCEKIMAVLHQHGYTDRTISAVQSRKKILRQKGQVERAVHHDTYPKANTIQGFKGSLARALNAEWLSLGL